MSNPVLESRGIKAIANALKQVEAGGGTVTGVIESPSRYEIQYTKPRQGDIKDLAPALKQLSAEGKTVTGAVWTPQGWQISYQEPPPTPTWINKPIGDVVWYALLAKQNLLTKGTVVTGVVQGAEGVEIKYTVPVPKPIYEPKVIPATTERELTTVAYGPARTETPEQLLAQTQLMKMGLTWEQYKEYQKSPQYLSDITGGPSPGAAYAWTPTDVMMIAAIPTAVVAPFVVGGTTLTGLAGVGASTATGAATGAMISGSMAAFEGQPVEQILKSAALGAAISGGISAAVSGVFAFKQWRTDVAVERALARDEAVRQALYGSAEPTPDFIAEPSQFKIMEESTKEFAQQVYQPTPTEPGPTAWNVQTQDIPKALMTVDKKLYFEKIFSQGRPLGGLSAIQDIAVTEFESVAWTPTFDLSQVGMKAFYPSLIVAPASLGFVSGTVGGLLATGTRIATPAPSKTLLKQFTMPSEITRTARVSQSIQLERLVTPTVTQTLTIPKAFQLEPTRQVLWEPTFDLEKQTLKQLIEPQPIKQKQRLTPITIPRFKDVVDVAPILSPSTALIPKAIQKEVLVPIAIQKQVQVLTQRFDVPVPTETKTVPTFAAALPYFDLSPFTQGKRMFKGRRALWMRKMQPIAGPREAKKLLKKFGI